MAVCPSYIGARVLRVTRLDSCGRPAYGECSQVVTDGFVSVEISPEVEEGETYTQRNAAGDLCVSERGQDALQWFTVSIEFCRVDPSLFSLMNPTWKVVRNAQGEATGFRVGTKFSDREGFALELWPKAATGGALCDDDAPEDSEPNGYFLLPYVLGTAPESWTLEDGVATFTLNGRTKGGSLWGRGPYNVVHDINGNPSPLLEPIDSGSASGDPDHFHTDIVTVPPPSAMCGCQTLEAITPGARGGALNPDPTQPNRVCFEVSGSAARRVTITWGDGTDPVTSRVGREECHLYTTTGTYTVTVADIDDPQKASTYEVTINEVPVLPSPVVSVSPTSGVTPLPVTLTVNNHGNGQVVIDWGDGTPTQTVAGGTATEAATYPHQYTVAGEHTITVTAVADDRAQGTATLNAVSPNPQVTATPDQGEAPLTVGFVIDNHGNGPVNVDWGDGTAQGTHPGDGTTSVDHTYNDPGSFEVTVTSQANATHVSTVQVEVTAPAPTTPDAPTNVTVTDPTATDLTVSWDWAQGEGAAATGFAVRYRTAPDGEWSAPESVPSTDRTLTITGLTASTEYEVGVMAVGADASSTEVTATGSTTA